MHQLISRWALAALIVAVAVGGFGPTVADASTPSDPAPGLGTTHGWRSPVNPADGFALVPRCLEGPNGLPQVEVGVRARMWSKGARINRFAFKVRLVPTGTDGQLQLPYAWSDTSSQSFNHTPQMRAKNLGRNTPRQDGLAAWDIEVRLVYGRAQRVDYNYKFRVPFTNPCDSWGGF